MVGAQEVGGGLGGLGCSRFVPLLLDAAHMRGQLAFHGQAGEESGVAVRFGLAAVVRAIDNAGPTVGVQNGVGVSPLRYVGADAGHARAIASVRAARKSAYDVSKGGVLLRPTPHPRWSCGSTRYPWPPVSRTPM